jgi:transposase
MQLHGHWPCDAPPPSPPLSAPSSPPPLFVRLSGCIDQLSEVERAAIVTLHKVGWTGRDIAHVIKCSENTVSLWVNRWRDEHSVADAERSGRPRCTSDETDAAIQQFAEEKVTTTPKEIVREMKLPVSPHTVRRRLDELGLFGCVQQTEHAFNEFHIQQRLAFANQYADWTEEDWCRVFFSDETPFYLGQHGRVYVQRPVGKALDPKYTYKEDPLKGKVSLWACICGHGLGHAELFVGSLNSTQHRDILRHSLVPTLRQFFPEGPWYFQQDNARFHTTPDTLAYLHEKGVTLIEWPPWSPDLNPIENLWNDLKRRVYARHPQTMEELEQSIREEWDATDLNFISHICRSMPHRLQLVLANHGHKISY